MRPASRIGDEHTCPLIWGGTSPSAHVGGAVLSPGAGTVMVAAAPAAHLADFMRCAGSPREDVLFEGAATVLFEQLPAGALAHGSAHGGVVVGGSAKVLIGGPTFALPANVTVVGEPGYQNKVIRDLYFLWTTPSGKEMFRRIEASGQMVKIYASDRDDARCLCLLPHLAALGGPSPSLIIYNPDRSRAKWDANENEIPCPSQVTLAHEMLHAMHFAEGDFPLTSDPLSPPNDPGIDRRETQVMGLGSYTNEYPSENSFRKDLGLPQRGLYNAPGTPSMPPSNLRPGKY